MKSYAVCVTYSWDRDAAVYLFDTEEEAADFLSGAYEAEFESDRESGYDSDGFLNDDRRYARIIKPSPMDNDVTDFYLAHVYE